MADEGWFNGDDGETKGFGEHDSSGFKAFDLESSGRGRQKEFRMHNIDFPETTRFPYRDLANVVLGANQDIKYHRSLVDRANAQKYVDSHRGWRLGADKDYNNDGVNDVILYNKFGDPVVINGYALANSEYPYRSAFYKMNPKKSDRMKVGGYNTWLKESFYGDKQRLDPKISNSEFITGWTGQGFRQRAFRESKSERNNLNRLIKARISEYVLEYMEDGEHARFFLSLLPWFQIFSFLFDHILLRDLIVVLQSNIKKSTQVVDVDTFKKLLKYKGNKQRVDEYLSEEGAGMKLLDSMLNGHGVETLFNMIGSNFRSFMNMIKSSDITVFSTNPEQRVQKQVWKEEIAARVDSLRMQTRNELNELIRKYKTA